MNRFAVRSEQEELIDQPEIPFADWKVCLQELNVVNTYLGGHSITIEGVKRLLGTRRPKALTILEIGCGGGDNLVAIDNWNRKTNAVESIKYIGVDINEACIHFAQNNCRQLDAEFITSDYQLVSFPENKPDIVFNSLFCHHFRNGQLVNVLQWMKLNSALGFFINDLHRHPVAYFSIKTLTRIFSRSYLVKNDGPVSVMRGFRRKDWHKLMNQASISQYSIHWRWAFRFLIIVKHAAG